MINVSIVGASGYSGKELIRILLTHPEVKIKGLYRSAKSEAIHIADMYGEFKNKLDLICKPLDVKEVISCSDLVFLALPHTQSMEYMKELLDAGKKVVDLSADFRIEDFDVYTHYYKKKHVCFELVNDAVYGLTEFYKEKIKEALLIANPGCFPSAVILGSQPILASDLINGSKIIVNANTGVTGAGRSLKTNLLYSEMNENMYAYKVGVHQHEPEMTQELSSLTGKSIEITFTAQIVPLDRGILATIYVPLNENADEKNIYSLYEKMYKKAPFVRLMELGIFPQVKNVAYTNYCDIGIKVVKEKNLLIIVSAIDNLGKGAASQAIQNMNVMYGLEETMGLM